MHALKCLLYVGAYSMLDKLCLFLWNLESNYHSERSSSLLSIALGLHCLPKIVAGRLAELDRRPVRAVGTAMWAAPQPEDTRRDTSAGVWSR